MYVCVYLSVFVVVLLLTYHWPIITNILSAVVKKASLTTNGETSQDAPLYSYAFHIQLGQCVLLRLLTFLTSLSLRKDRFHQVRNGEQQLITNAFSDMTGSRSYGRTRTTLYCKLLLHTLPSPRCGYFLAAVPSACCKQLRDVESRFCLCCFAAAVSAR